MSDGFFEFSEDDSSAGFRLQRLEVYNWGTFHNRVYSFPLDGNNGLLTGDIGSGKSTLVDAVTTLLVPAHRVSYNKAAGADFKERSLRSYVMGYYKSERSDGGYSAKPVALRKEGTSHSVILGVFHNEGFSQTVTLAQVFFQKESTGQPDRFFVLSSDELAILNDFSDFGKELAPLKKRLKNRENTEVFDSFSQYGAAFRRRFGLQNEQALELFHQTVSLKTVGNLTSFVQEHMLESFDSETILDNLIHHFEDLDKAHEAILRAKKQIEQLTPLVDHLDRHRQTEEEVGFKVQCREDLKFYFAGLKKRFLHERIGKEELKKNKLALSLSEKQDGLSRSRAERDEIKQAIASSGGDRLENLKSELKRLETEKSAKLRRSEEYNRLAELLEFPLLESGDIFSGNRHSAEEKIEVEKSQKSQIQNSLMESNVEFTKLRDEHKVLEQEIHSLRSRKSNISSRQIDIRKRVCHDLNLNETDLPFAGELIKVKEEELEWEGALERVLRNFALSLLVPDSLYDKVTAWVDDTNLRGRLVYYRVGDFRKSHTINRDKYLLPEKMDFKEDNPFRDWLKEQIIKRFDYTCCDNLDQFRRSTRGVTRAGQMKGSAVHHEKDDRFSIDDRSRYVLGWRNQAKIGALEQQKAEAEELIRLKGEEISRSQNRLNQLEDRLDYLKKLFGYSYYEDLNWQPLAGRIESVKSEIVELESRSDILKTLQDQLLRVEEQIRSFEGELDDLKKDLARTEQKLDDYNEALSAEEAILSESSRSPGDIDENITPLLSQYLEGKKIYLETCGTKEQQVREKLQSEIDAGKKRLDRLLQSIIGTMEGFRRDYPAETRDMDASLESGEEYRQLLHKLVKDNLPQYEAQFKTLLNENTIREIAGFQARLNTECQKIRERVELINKSMSGIEYNKDRYIYLEAMNTNDMEIRNFRQELKSCIEGSLSGEGNQQYTESKFLQVKDLINRFKGREGRSDLDKKWTAKVTDVRNWFAFAASERWIADNSEYEHYTDSGGKSGGQKEKLAYTVLAASLAYQFGLEWGEVRSRSFRFVVIDEAFGRGSDESARYGLDLFRKLNLQLLIVTPLQKIHIIEPYVSSVGFVHNPEGGDSRLRCLSITQYHKEKERFHT